VRAERHGERPNRTRLKQARARRLWPATVALLESLVFDCHRGARARRLWPRHRFALRAPHNANHPLEVRSASLAVDDCGAEANQRVRLLPAVRACQACPLGLHPGTLLPAPFRRRYARLVPVLHDTPPRASCDRFSNLKAPEQKKAARRPAALSCPGADRNSLSSRGVKAALPFRTG